MALVWRTGERKLLQVRILSPPPSPAEAAGYGGRSPPVDHREGGLRHVMYYVYILYCRDNKPYTGCSNNLPERMRRHEKGEVPATKEMLPVKLVSYTAFCDKYKAFKFEKYLKSGSGRAFLKKHF